MATKKFSSTKRSSFLRLTLRVQLEEGGQTFPEMVAYTFDRNGRYLDQEKLPAKQSAEIVLNLPKALKGEPIRVLLGPPLQRDQDEAPSWALKLLKRSPDEKDAPSYTMLLRKGAIEKRLIMKRSAESLEMVLFPDDWKKYLLCRCQVKGKVIKPVALPDGSSSQLNVCHALVLIYEVDKWPRLIYKLPDKVLFDLRDRLKGLIEEPPRLKIPFPEPDPFLLKRSGTLNRLSASREVLPPPSVEPRVPEIQASLDPVIRAYSGSQLRLALVDAGSLIWPYLCQWPDIFSIISKDLIKVVSTDIEGKFETSIGYPCNGDKPDLYFKVYQFNGGTFHLLSDPGVACHTYWNYSCGTEIRIETNDPAARTCVAPDPVDPPEGVDTWVMPFKVGNILLSRIKANGLVDYGGITDAPFASNLGFRHGFSSDIPSTKLYHYRWSFQKEGDTGWTDFVEPYASPILRHYVKEVPGEYPTFPVCVLGPKGVNGQHLYRFKPHDPTACDDYSPGGTAYWPTDNWFGDIYTGRLRSGSLPGGIDLANGRYRFKLEVYNKAGSRVAPTSTNFQFIVPTGFASDGVSIETRAALASEIEDEGFVFTLHIDNRHCEAVLDAPSIGSVSAGDECGFIRYAINDLTGVEVPFHALHDDNFAFFDLRIRRGHRTVSLVDDAEVAASSAASIAPAPYGVPHSYAGDGNGNFSHNFPRGHLLGTCTEAGFAETLHVYAKATNGWVRIDSYDAADSRGFALAPLGEEVVSPSPS